MKTVVHYVIMLAVLGVTFVWQPWRAEKEAIDTPVQRGVESGGGLSAPGLVKVSDAAAVGDAGAEKIPDSMTCPCGSPAVCVGPKGGRYCVTIDGKKRYK